MSPPRRSALSAVALAVSSLAASALAAAACDGRDAPPAQVRAQTPRAGTPPKRTPAAKRPFVTFTDVAKASGLAAHICHAGRKEAPNWVLESAGGGAAVLDYDGDGDMDLLVVESDALDLRGELVREPDARSRLWRNDGGMRFTDVTDAAGIDVRGYGLSGAAGDYDGDGDWDVMLTGFLFTRLLRNRGDGTFQDVTEAAGLPVETKDTTTSSAWGDLDGDGLLDLFLTNYADQWAEMEKVRKEKLPPRHCLERGFTIQCGPQGLVHARNRVFFQRPDHTFEERTATHLTGPESYSFQVVLSDFDQDGDLDAYVANDGEPNFVYVNDGQGHLTDRGPQSGAALDFSAAPQASMGVDVADYDRDGWQDVFVTNFSDQYNALYRNSGGKLRTIAFDDVSYRTLISATSRDRLSWGTKLCDLDGDGVLDVFVACGHVYAECAEFSHGQTSYLQRLLLMRGEGPPAYTFADVTDSAGPAFAEKRLWRGAAFADFDDDGDWDVFVTAQRDPPALLRNDGGERAPWVRLDLRGRPPLTTPAGARVTIELPGGAKLVEELHLGSSYGNSNDPRILRGTPGAARVPKVEVRWPDGTTTVLTDVDTRKTVVVTQPAR